MHRRLVVLALGAVLLTLAACGSDGASPPASTTTAPSDAGNPAGSTPATTVGGPSTTASEAVCDELQSLYLEVLMQSGTAVQPEVDVEAIDALADQVEELELPAETRAAFSTWIRAWSEFAEAATALEADGGILAPENADRVQEIGEIMKDPEVTAASADMERFFDENCRGGTTNP